MKAVLDTSVLIAVFYGDHEHHDASLSLFVTLTEQNGCCGAHTLAELYSTLTGMPGRYRVTGDQAMLFIGSVRERLTPIGLSPDEYAAELETWSKMGVSGGTIYDALLASCALNVHAETIYSWNQKHYRQLGPAVSERLKTPAAG